MGLTKTVWGEMLPGCVSVYNTIVLRTSFNAVPATLEESARIDGAGDLKILINVVLPLSGAAIATISLFYIVGTWGAWYNALVYLQDKRELYPLQMFLREMLIEDKTTDVYLTAQGGKASNQHLIKEIVKYCIIIVSTLPILVVYPFIQKYFVKGVMVGALKE
jgi:putative aldouronate transport system permease protein